MDAKARDLPSREATSMQARPSIFGVRTAGCGSEEVHAAGPTAPEQFTAQGTREAAAWVG